MQNKSSTGIIIAIIVILVIIGIVLAINKPDTDSGTPTGTPSATTTPVATSTSATSSDRYITYTLADVALHATQADCWTTINGGVYNLTPFVTQHPGGVPNILKVCGKDGTAAFTTKHSTSTKPNAQLEKLKIGILTQ